RLDELVERYRHEASALHGYHGTAAAAEQETHGTVRQIAAVLRIERDRIGAAQLIADVLVRDRHAQAALAEPPLHFGLDLARQIDLREAHVPVVVALDILELGQFAGIELVDQPFSKH